MSSAPQPLAYFGRSFSVSITPQGGGTPVVISSTLGTPALRVTFETDSLFGMVVWQAVVTIYNLGATTANAISSGSAQSTQSEAFLNNSLSFTDAVSMGDIVQISAGYQSTSENFSPSANLIYQGNLLQSIGTRDNVTDTKLILRCVNNLAVSQFGFANISRSKESTDLDFLNQILTNVGMTIASIDDASRQALENSKYPRGQATFERPYSAINQIMKQHNIFPWVDGNGLNMRSFGASAASPLPVKYTFGPSELSVTTGSTSGTVKPTIIGTPDQTQTGVSLRVLLDSQVKIGDPFQLAASTAINGYQFGYGTLPPLPNYTGTYIIAGIRHVGDTRGDGDDWYTQITAMTPQWFSIQQAATIPAN